MYLLTSRYKTPKMTADGDISKILIFQFISIFLYTFFMNWLGYMSDHSWWVVTFAHFTFNQLNPKILGSVYTNTQGMFVGPLWKINGEGLMGCIVGAIYLVVILVFLV